MLQHENYEQVSERETGFKSVASGCVAVSRRENVRMRGERRIGGRGSGDYGTRTMTPNRYYSCFSITGSNFQFGCLDSKTFTQVREGVWKKRKDSCTAMPGNLHHRRGWSKGNENNYFFKVFQLIFFIV